MSNLIDLHYTVEVHCRNRLFHNMLTILKGQTVSQCPCPVCGCTTLETAPKVVVTF